MSCEVIRILSSSIGEIFMRHTGLARLEISFYFRRTTGVHCVEHTHQILPRIGLDYR